MTDVSLGGITPLTTPPTGSFLLIGKVSSGDATKKDFGGIATNTYALTTALTTEAAARAAADTTLNATLSALPGANVAFDATYSANGAIDPTKVNVAFTGNTALAMTLTNGTGTRPAMWIKNLSTSSCTVTLTLDGASNSVVSMLPKACLQIWWSVALTSWELYGQVDPGVTIASLPTLAVGVTGNFLPILDADGVTVKKIAPASLRAAIDQGVAALTSAASIAIDLASQRKFTLLLATNATLAFPTNLLAGSSFYIRVTQDTTGNRTLGFASGYRAPGGTPVVLSTSANAIDVLKFECFDTGHLEVSILKAYG